MKQTFLAQPLIDLREDEVLRLAQLPAEVAEGRQFELADAKVILAGRDRVLRITLRAYTGTREVSLDAEPVEHVD